MPYQPTGHGSDQPGTDRGLEKQFTHCLHATSSKMEPSPSFIPHLQSLGESIQFDCINVMAIVAPTLTQMFPIPYLFRCMERANHMETVLSKNVLHDQGPVSYTHLTLPTIYSV